MSHAPGPPGPTDGTGSTAEPSRRAGDRRSGLRWLYARILLVEALTLLALWTLQVTVGGG